MTKVIGIDLGTPCVATMDGTQVLENRRARNFCCSIFKRKISRTTCKRDKQSMLGYIFAVKRLIGKFDGPFSISKVLIKL